MTVIQQRNTNFGILAFQKEKKNEIKVEYAKPKKFISYYKHGRS